MVSTKTINRGARRAWSSSINARCRLHSAWDLMISGLGPNILRTTSDLISVVCLPRRVTSRLRRPQTHQPLRVPRGIALAGLDRDKAPLVAARLWSSLSWRRPRSLASANPHKPSHDSVHSALQHGSLPAHPARACALAKASPHKRRLLTRAFDVITLRGAVGPQDQCPGLPRPRTQCLLPSTPLSCGAIPTRMFGHVLLLLLSLLAAPVARLTPADGHRETLAFRQRARNAHTDCRASTPRPSRS